MRERQSPRLLAPTRQGELFFFERRYAARRARLLDAAAGLRAQP